MKIGLNWLKDYIAFDYTVEELARTEGEEAGTLLVECGRSL